MKTVFITGATAGIGAELARQYNRMGYRVLFCGRRADRVEALSIELNQKAAAKGFIIDVTKETDFKSVVEYLNSIQVKLDLVIANAGIGIAGDFERLSNQDYQKQFDTNIFGVFNSIRPFISQLKETQGQIAIVGSGNSYISVGKNSPYCISKFAVRAFADALWLEMKPHQVAVTLICPGFVESEIRQVDNHGVYRPEAKDPVPKWLQLSTPKAANEIIRGLKKRKPEIWITHHIKLLIVLEMFFPAISRWIKTKIKV